MKNQFVLMDIPAARLERLISLHFQQSICISENYDLTPVFGHRAIILDAEGNRSSNLQN